MAGSNFYIDNRIRDLRLYHETLLLKFFIQIDIYQSIFRYFFRKATVLFSSYKKER